MSIESSYKDLFCCFCLIIFFLLSFGNYLLKIVKVGKQAERGISWV